MGLWAGTTSRVARAAQCGAGPPSRLWRSGSRSLISVPLKAISLEAETSLLSLNPQEVHTLSRPVCLTEEPHRVQVFDVSLALTNDTGTPFLAQELVIAS